MMTTDTTALLYLLAFIMMGSSWLITGLLAWRLRACQQMQAASPAAVPATADDLRYRSLFQQSNDAVFILDLNGRHMEANQRSADMLGYTMAEIAHLSYRDLVIAEEHGQSDNVLQRLLSGERMPPYERTFRRKDGTPVRVEINVEVVRDAHGTPLHIQSIARDVSERIRAQEQALALTLEKERFKLVTHFIQNAAHEFRTPLAIIGTSTHILMHSQDEGRRLQKAEQVKAQLRRITRLVDMMLWIARLESYTYPSLTPFNLITLVQIVSDELRVLYPPGPAMTITAPPGLPYVMGDIELLREALQQLLDNACRFTRPEGHIVITATQEEGRVWLVIEDNGVGISAEALPKIFDLFWRQDAAHTTAGLGLGLSIVRRVMALHDGSIEVSSQPDIGTRVRLGLRAVGG